MGGVIVVADTHFGIKKDNISMPGYFVDFMKYLNSNNKESIKIWDGNIKEKIIEKPDKIIFLGDIVELWDSEDEAVNFCISSLLPTLSEMEAEKIYVLGNHDNILNKALLSEAKEYYYFGKAQLKLVEDVYPSDNFLKIGEQNYLFVHGHQFDKCFTNTGKLYRILPELRKFSNSLTNYIPFLLILSLTLGILGYILTIMFPNGIDFSSSIVTLNLFSAIIKWKWSLLMSFGKKEIIILLFFLSIPKLYMWIARPCWEKINRVKYKRDESIKNFIRWWGKFIKNMEIPDNTNVVYGHTHFLNYINLRDDRYRGSNRMYNFYQRKLVERKITGEKPTLVNISAWVKDTKNKEGGEKYKNVMVASFLHIDEEGFEFYGWDWYDNRIFHIPKIAIIERMEKGLVSEQTAQVLRKIGWPEKLVVKWTTYFSLNE